MRRESKYRKKVNICICSSEKPLIRILLLLPQIKKTFGKADKENEGKLTREQWLRVLTKAGCQTSM